MPDVLLTKFIQSTDIINPGEGQPPPQQVLESILNDRRWTRRMLEDWFKKGAPSRSFSLTPNPEFRAIYLMLLASLERKGQDKSGLYIGKVFEASRKEAVTEEEKRLKERIDAWKVEQGIEVGDEDWEMAGGEVGDRRMTDRGRQEG